MRINMNSTLNTQSGLAASTSAQGSVTREKAAHVSSAKNGFVVVTERTGSYGSDVHIAPNVEDVQEILQSYFG